MHEWFPVEPQICPSFMIRTKNWFGKEKLKETGAYVMWYQFKAKWGQNLSATSLIGQKLFISYKGWFKGYVKLLISCSYKKNIWDGWYLWVWFL